MPDSESEQRQESSGDDRPVSWQANEKPPVTQQEPVAELVMPAQVTKVAAPVEETEPVVEQ